MSQSHAIRVESADPAQANDRALRRRLDELERQFDAMLAVVAPPGAEANVTKLPVNASQYSIVRRIIRARRTREQHFPTGLFSDPAWDMLLELYAAHLAQQRVSISALCTATMVPTTTGLRWISTLEESELVQRRNDPLDGRRVFIELTTRGQESMSVFFKEHETSAVI